MFRVFKNARCSRVDNRVLEGKGYARRPPLNAALSCFLVIPTLSVSRRSRSASINLRTSITGSEGINSPPARCIKIHHGVFESVAWQPGVVTKPRSSEDRVIIARLVHGRGFESNLHHNGRSPAIASEHIIRFERRADHAPCRIKRAQNFATCHPDFQALQTVASSCWQRAHFADRFVSRFLVRPRPSIGLADRLNYIPRIRDRPRTRTTKLILLAERLRESSVTHRCGPEYNVKEDGVPFAGRKCGPIIISLNRSKHRPLLRSEIIGHILPRPSYFQLCDTFPDTRLQGLRVNGRILRKLKDRRLFRPPE